MVAYRLQVPVPTNETNPLEESTLQTLVVLLEKLIVPEPKEGVAVKVGGVVVE